MNGYYIIHSIHSKELKWIISVKNGRTIMNTIPLLKDPNIIVRDIKKISEKRKELYEQSPQKPNFKIEIITERCRSELCPLDHTVINITTDFMLGEELLAICRYLKKNKLPFCYMDNSFKVILN